MEEVGALADVELEHAGEGIEDLGRRLDVSSLLEPRVPGEADPGELGDLLAAQARCAAAANPLEPRLLG